MSLVSDITSTVKQIFGSNWETREGRAVPDSPDLGLGNEAMTLNGTVMYADLSGSTAMVDTQKAHFAAEVYKAFLHCAAKIVRAESGAVTAYDGDRIMAVFVGDSKNTSAARSALRINHAVAKIINPAIRTQYPSSQFQVKHVVGIDTSQLLVARTGVRGANDLVWVGRAANYAAKLTALPDRFASYITADVYNNMREEAKTSNGTPMWEAVAWTEMNNMRLFRSNWHWAID